MSEVKRLSFYFCDNPKGYEAIKDLPLIKPFDMQGLINKRCKFLDLAVPIVGIGGVEIDFREPDMCPMCSHNVNMLGKRCKDCWMAINGALPKINVILNSQVSANVL